MSEDDVDTVVARVQSDACGAPDPRIRLVVIDDCALFREGITHALSGFDDIDLVDQADTISDAFRIVYQRQPDIMLLCVDTSGADLAAVRALRAIHPGLTVVILEHSGGEDRAKAAIEAGARAFILKSVSGPELVATLRSIHEDKSIVTVWLSEPGIRPGADLTQRERQILDQVSRGQSNKQIARTFEITEKTVKQHITRILEKLDVRNRVEAAMLFHKRDSGF